jgi:hypothetical protein
VAFDNFSSKVSPKNTLKEGQMKLVQVVFVAIVVALLSCASFPLNVRGGTRAKEEAAQPAEQGIHVNKNCFRIEDGRWCAYDPIEKQWVDVVITIVVFEVGAGIVPQTCASPSEGTWCAWRDGRLYIAERPESELDGLLRKDGYAAEGWKNNPDPVVDNAPKKTEPAPKSQPAPELKELQEQVDRQGEAIRSTNGAIKILADAAAKQPKGILVVKGGYTITRVELFDSAAQATCAGMRTVPVVNMDKGGESVPIFMTGSTLYVGDRTINQAFSGHGAKMVMCLPAQTTGEMVGCTFEAGFTNATAIAGNAYGGKFSTEDPALADTQLYRTKKDPKKFCSFLQREE